jgi:hypothetical protein
MRIFISNLFKELLKIEQCCLELGYYKLGTLDSIRIENSQGDYRLVGGNRLKEDYDNASESDMFEDLNNFELDYIDNDQGRSPTTGVYTFNGIIQPLENKMIISLKVPTYDQGMSENEYKVIYCIYKNLLTGNGGIAFIITGDELDENEKIFIYGKNQFDGEERIFNSKPLNLSLETNIITLPIPEYKCTLLVTQKDDDIVFLENSGIGKNYNIFRYIEGHPTKPVDKNFLAKNSFDSFYKTTRSEDEFSHNSTVFINKFGIKIY